MAAATGLSGARLLECWEQARDRHPLDRALLLLGAAFPDTPYDRLAELPIGARDAALLELRRATFGPDLLAYVDCPACGERLEFALDSRALELPATGETALTAGGRSFQLPTSRDLALAIHETDPERAARRLADLCLLPPESPAGPVEWSEPILDNIEARMAEADPQADVELAIGCAACGGNWTIPFDIGGFLWEELECRAVHLLHDVYLLARAYGWSEGEVLALSDARRTAYLDLVCP
jgi:hypothetical protein